jgi:hypothetical protein
MPGLVSGDELCKAFAWKAVEIAQEYWVVCLVALLGVIVLCVV